MIEEFGHGFRVVLFRKRLNESQKVDGYLGTDGTKTGTDEQVVVKLSEDELNIINIIKDNPMITQLQLQELTGIPLRTIKRIMSGLQKNGFSPEQEAIVLVNGI